jgi:hypothetical protein
VPRRKLKDLLESATSTMCLGWRICDFPWAFGEFLKYIVEKYNVNLDVEVEYEDREKTIYAIIPVTAFKVKPPMTGLEESAKAAASALSLLVPQSQPRELGPLYSAIANSLLLSLPAGAFERKRVHNRDCYAKYIDSEKVVVACW